MKKDDQGQVDTKRNTQLQQHYKQKKKLRFLQRKLPGFSRHDNAKQTEHSGTEDELRRGEGQTTRSR